MIRYTLTGLLLLMAASATFAATFEVPGNGGKASGIGSISGWKCPPNDNISVVIDGGAPIPVPSQVRRNDTSGACGNDGRNGYITQINFNLLGNGSHQASIRQNGVQFAAGAFTVTTFGQSFLTGASGTYVLQDFPNSGKTATVQWIQGAQNFVIVGTGGSPSQGCPSTGPIKNLTADCSDSVFFYTKGQGVAGITSDGEVVAICLTAIGDPDVICVGGDVSSATTFSLAVTNLNGGPFVPLDGGSGGNIANNGQTLNFTVVLDGESFPFTGLGYSGRDSLAATAGAQLSDSVTALRDALRNAGGGNETSAEGLDSGPASDALGRVLDSLGR